MLLVFTSIVFTIINTYISYIELIELNSKMVTFTHKTKKKFNILPYCVSFCLCLLVVSVSVVLFVKELQSLLL